MRFLFLLPLVLAGCATLNPFGRGAPTATDPAQTGVEAPAPLPAPATAPVASPLSGPATSAAALDTVSEAEKDAARASAAAAPAGGELGAVTVSLGSPTDPGLWVKSALVSEDTPGTVRTGDGDAIAVTLRPLGGAGGPQISLSALQALGLPLAGLHTVTLAQAG